MPARKATPPARPKKPANRRVMTTPPADPAKWKRIASHRGRPLERTQELIDEILTRSSVGEPLAQICRDDHMPAVTTFWEWQKADRDLDEAYARARLAGIDAIAVEALEIANTPIEGKEYTTVTGPDGTTRTVTTKEMLGHRRLQIDTRLKLMALWDPVRYGAKLEMYGKVEHEHTFAASFAQAMSRSVSGYARGEDRAH